MFFALFFISWGMHFYGSLQDHNIERVIEGKSIMNSSQYILKADFWFETFQNWQSEFLSVASIVIFTIFLRQKGSPESKPVDTPNLKRKSEIS